jgi:hypothetical protein
MHKHDPNSWEARQGTIRQAAAGMALLVTAVAVLLGTAGCRTGGNEIEQESRLDWRTMVFCKGQVSMELPGKTNYPLGGKEAAVYVRCLKKEWIALTVGSMVISEVAVQVSVGGTGNHTSLLGDVFAAVARDNPVLAGRFFVSLPQEHTPGESTFRDAMLVLPDGESFIYITVPTFSSPGHLEIYNYRFAIDDAIFQRVVDSVRLNDKIPPRKAFR